MTTPCANKPKESWQMTKREMLIRSTINKCRQARVNFNETFEYLLLRKQSGWKAQPDAFR
jgi:hypothetical protein